MRQEYRKQLKEKAALGDPVAQNALDRMRAEDRARKKKTHQLAAAGDPLALATVEKKRAKMRAYQENQRKPIEKLPLVRRRFFEVILQSFRSAFSKFR